MQNVFQGYWGNSEPIRVISSLSVMWSVLLVCWIWFTVWLRDGAELPSSKVSWVGALIRVLRCKRQKGTLVDFGEQEFLRW